MVLFRRTPKGLELTAEAKPRLAHDASTNALVRRYRKVNGRA